MTLRLRRRAGDAPRHLADDPTRRAHRPGRRLGFGQDDARVPDRPLLRPERAERVRLDGVDVRELTLDLAAVARSTSCSRRASCSRRPSGRTSPSPGPTPATPRSRPPPASPRPTTSSSSCPTGTTRSSASAASPFRAVSASASRWPARRSPTPACSILDDATSAIDAHTEEAIHASLAEELGTRTTVLIAHRSSTLRLADRVIVLDERSHRRRGDQRRAVAHLGALPRAAHRPRARSRRTRAAARSTRSTPRRGRAGRRRRTPAPHVDLATLFAGMAGGGGGPDRRPRRPRRGDPRAAGPGRGAAAAARRPRRRPRRGRCPRALVAASADSCTRFRWALRAGRRARRSSTPAPTLVGPVADPPRHRRRRRLAPTRRTLAAMCVAFLGVQLLSWGNQIVELLHTSRTAERMLYTLRARTFAHLQRLSLDYYDKEMGGRIMTRMTTDVEALAQLLQQGLLLALTSIVSLRRCRRHPARARRAPGPRRVRRAPGARRCHRLVPARLAPLVPAGPRSRSRR